MKPSKGKTKEDTWKTEELLKYIKAAQGDHPDDSDKRNAAKKRHKEDEPEERRHRDRDRDRQKDRDRDRDRDRQKDRDRDRDRDRQKDRDRDRDQNDDKVRNKEKESDGDRHKDLERDKVHKKVKDGERDKDRGKKKERESEKHKDGDRDNYQGGDKNSGHRIRDEDKEWDLNIERSTKRGYESERHRDKERDRKKEQDKYREIGRENDGNGDQQSKHRHKRDKGNMELSKDDRYKEKERRHQERKEKEGRNTEGNEEGKEKKRRSADFRDDDYEWRHRERKEHGHREKRRKDREEPGLETRAEEMERKHRERKVKESKEDKRKHQYKDTKDPDREWEHKEREKRDLERREDRERKHRLKKGREEQERQGEYKEQSGRRKREQRSVPEFTDESKLKGITEDQEKLAGALSEEGTGRLQSTWRSSQVTLSDDDLAEGEEVVMESKPTFESPNYEDDFEDYEDDFEEGECELEEEGEEKEQENEEIPAGQRAEIEAIQKAITAENEKISATWIRSNQKTNEEEPKKDFEESQSRGPVRGTYIDFVAAKQREISSKVACKQKKRSAELLRLIDLDFSVNFSMLDLPPLNEYDVYIKSFGRTNTKQAFVQSNEDDVDRDIQTDEIETVDKWTQHPAEGSLVCGGANICDAFSSDTLIKNIDSQRLTNFLRSACQVIAVLLEEDQAEDQASKNIQSKAASLSVSDGCCQLNTNLPFLHGREVLCLHFSQVQRQTLLSVHSLPKEPGMVQVASYYIICVWNIWEPSFPQKVLICESEVQCCCFGPGNVLSVFAGTVDGSIVAWDLREISIIHYSLQIGGQEWTLRFPTFTTDGILTAANHACAVKALDPVSSASYDDSIGLSLLTSQQGSSGLSFQLASLDESGLLNLWVVVELQKADLAGSLTDLGLIPGGKMKLIHSSAIDTIGFFPRNLMQLGRPRTLSIKFLPSDPNHFFIGTDIGLVSRGTRHGLQAAPRLYKPQTSGAGSVQVTCIDFCHFGRTMFLVGCSDGTIRLHSVTKECPILQWNESTQGNPIQNVLWALTRPGMFFVLDTASHVYVWDLLQDVSKPVAEESLQHDRIATMAILGDPEKPNASSGLMLAKQSGAIEMQYLQKNWSEPHLNELETLNYLLQKTV